MPPSDAPPFMAGFAVRLAVTFDVVHSASGAAEKLMRDMRRGGVIDRRTYQLHSALVGRVRSSVRALAATGVEDCNLGAHLVLILLQNTGFDGSRGRWHQKDAHVRGRQGSRVGIQCSGGASLVGIPRI